MITFHRVRWKNFLSYGNEFTEVQLDRARSTLVVGINGAGKCVAASTEIEVRAKSKETERKLREHLSRISKKKNGRGIVEEKIENVAVPEEVLDGEGDD